MASSREYPRFVFEYSGNVLIWWQRMKDTESDWLRGREALGEFRFLLSV